MIIVAYVDGQLKRPISFLSRFTLFSNKSQAS